MSSSFKRRAKKDADGARQPPPPSPSPSPDVIPPPPTGVATSSSVLPGTMPWTGGLVVTSFGLREFDALLLSSSSSSSSSSSRGSSGGGGGQPLRSSILLEEDRLSDDLSRSLCRCWVAEGISQGHAVILAGTSPPGCIGDGATGGGAEEWSSMDEEGGGGDEDDDDGSTREELRDFLASLPRNLHLDKVRSREVAAAADADAGREEKDGIGDDGGGGGGGGGISGGRGREPIPAIVEEDENDDDENDQHDDGDDGAHDDDGGDGGEKEGLINAWQYRRSIQDARRGIVAGGGGGGGRGGATGRGGTYCHSYDLSGRMLDQFPPSPSGAVNTPLDNATIVDCSPTAATAAAAAAAGGGRRARGMDLFRRLWSHLVSTSRSRPNTVIRLFLHRLPVGAGSIALPLLMSKVRGEDLPVVVLVTIRPWRWLSSPPPRRDGEYDAVGKLDALSSLRRTADVALSLESFSSQRSPPPPEFSLLRGILSVRRCAPQAASGYADAVTSKRPLADRFGVKRDGRKITLQLLHLPPEGHGVGGGRGSGGGGVRSVGVASVVADDEDSRRPRGDGTAGRSTAGGCSSLGGGGASLDF